MNISVNYNNFTPTSTPVVYIIHENHDWVKPLFDELKSLDIPFEDWFINNGKFDLSSIPPQGVFYNRMSASSHTREHRYAVELAGPILAWLQAHGRQVINSRDALNLEIKKAEQYISLQAHGIKTPMTVIANNKEDLLEAADNFSGPFIYKPNRGGKGTGVELFENVNSFKTALDKRTDLQSIDGIHILQEYIKPVDGHIVRMEFINGKFYYAVKVDASDGFELCPADSCQINDAFCPANGEASSKFKIVDHFDDPNMAKYEAFMSSNGIQIGAIEFVADHKGQKFVYDVNINTNYNRAAELDATADINGMRAIAKFLGEELDQILAKSKQKEAV